MSTSATQRAADDRALRRGRATHPAASTVRGCDAPDTPRRSRRISANGRGARQPGRLPRRAADTEDAIAGVYNVSEIVRGAFQSAFLGYYAFMPTRARATCARGCELTVRHAFDELGLHRLQANVQPENVASVQLIRALGFEPRSRSPRYLFLDGEWRDHVGYAACGSAVHRWSAPRARSALHDVVADDHDGLLDIRVARDQRTFVGPVAEYLAICLLDMQWQPLAIRRGRRAGRVRDVVALGDRRELLDRRVPDRPAAPGPGLRSIRAPGPDRGAPREAGCREIVLTYQPANAAARSPLRLARVPRDRRESATRSWRDSVSRRAPGGVPKPEARASAAETSPPDSAPPPRAP